MRTTARRAAALRSEAFGPYGAEWFFLLPGQRALRVVDASGRFGVACRQPHTASPARGSESLGHPHAFPCVPAIRVPKAISWTARYRWGHRGNNSQAGEPISPPHRALAAYKRVPFLLIGPSLVLDHRHTFPLLGAPANQAPRHARALCDRSPHLEAPATAAGHPAVSDGPEGECSDPQSTLRISPPPLSRRVSPSCAAAFVAMLSSTM